MCFSVFVWTLVLVFLSVRKDSCVCVSQCLYGLVVALALLCVYMDSFACFAFLSRCMDS